MARAGGLNEAVVPSLAPEIAEVIVALAKAAARRDHEATLGKTVAPPKQ